MEIVENKKPKIQMVRIIIGSTITGESGIRKPIYSFRVKSQSSKEVYSKLKELLKNEK